MSTEQNKTLVRRFGDLINAQNLDAAFALFTSDFVDHGLPPGTPPGVESSRQFFRGQFAAFPDLQATFLDTFAEDDKVVSRIELEGTHVRPLMSIPPTGKHVKVYQIRANARRRDLTGACAVCCPRPDFPSGRPPEDILIPAVRRAPKRPLLSALGVIYRKNLTCRAPRSVEGVSTELAPCTSMCLPDLPCPNQPSDFSERILADWTCAPSYDLYCEQLIM